MKNLIENIAFVAPIVPLVVLTFGLLILAVQLFFIAVQFLTA